MKENLVVKLPEKINSDLKEIARDEGLSEDEIIRKALQDYIFIKKFRKLRSKMVAKAQARGFFSDEDIFEKVS